MSIINGLSIRNFRSFERLDIEHLENLTSIVGINNSGKSNILRSLNLFFNGEVEPGIPIDLERDYNRTLLTRRKKREISVTITFKLPSIFNMRKGTEYVKDLLYSFDTFKITKTWRQGEIQPQILLNDGFLEKSSDIDAIHKFISMITFRYIPHNVNPLAILNNRGDVFLSAALRKLRNYRSSVARDEKTISQFLDALSREGQSFLRNISQSISDVLGREISFSAAFPRSAADLIEYLPLQYSFNFGDRTRIEAYLQGAGVQLFTSLLLLFALDKTEPSRTFGWKQAFIWAIEEPENSLHKSMEAQLAAFLRNTVHQNQRFQVITTTHSEIVTAYSDVVIVLDPSTTGEIEVFTRANMHDAIEKMSLQGIAKYIHPILANPLDTILLVEGKTDKLLLEYLANHCNLNVDYIVIEPSHITNSGGASNIRKFVEDYRIFIKHRPGRVIALFDWDVNNDQIERLQRIIANGNFTSTKLDPAYADRAVGELIRGIERFLSSSFYEAYYQSIQGLDKTEAGLFVVTARRYDSVKSTIQRKYTEMIESGSFSCSYINPLKRAVESILSHPG